MNTPTTSVARKSNDILNEVLFIPSGDNTQAQQLSRLHKAGKLRKLYAGVYTSNLRSETSDVVTRNWSAILGYLAPNCVLAFRSALEHMPHQGLLFISRTSGARSFALPGLTVTALVNPKRAAVSEAAKPGANDIPYKAFFTASQARGFLENFTNDKRLTARQFSRKELTEQLDRILILRGEKGLSQLRDEAREVAQKLDMPQEFKALDSLIGVLLGTNAATKQTTKQALARANGRPYDPQRLELFENVAAQLRTFPFADISEPARQGPARTVFAFAESYFSNYIEGTTFTVEEAEDIVFKGKIIPTREADSHDVMGTFEAALRDPIYSQPPQTVEDFLAWIKQVNATVMRSRPEKNPGEWKSRANQAGMTLFVVPELVPGTLKEAFGLTQTFSHPMQIALFAMFLVAEVHPFQDGNGRTSRLLMNSYLSNKAQCRIIVPTVYREDFILSLKALTNQANANAFIRAMRLCQEWTCQLPFESVASLDACLSRTHAKEHDNKGFKLLSPLTGEKMAVPL